MISVREIQKTYGSVRALQGVSFEIGPGEVVGLLGPNGAGKSTTLKILTCFLAQDAGSVTIDHLDTRTHSLQIRKRIGYLPESAPLYPEMSPRGYLNYRCQLHGLHGRDRKRHVDAAMDRCQIADVARRRIGTLSKGYRQRVGLAAALLCDPPILILDEPSNGLDPTQILQTRSLIRDLSCDRTMIVSSHILPEIERLASRVIIIAGGQVRADAQLRDLAGSTTTRIWQAQLKAVPDDLIESLKTRSGILSVSVSPIRVSEVSDAPVCSEAQSDDDGSWMDLTVHSRADVPDPRPEIAKQAAMRMIHLRELREIKPSLETFFAEAVEAPEPAQVGNSTERRGHP